MSSSSSPKPKPPPSTSRRPKKCFTKKDEIDLLTSLLSSAGAPVLEGRFSKAQIRNKIRRLKQKYFEQAQSQPSFKTDHDRITFEISRQIWGRLQLPLQPQPAPAPAKRAAGSTINLSDFPYLMRQVAKESATNNEVYKQGLIGLGEDILKGLDKKWMELEMEEAAIQARIRTELDSSMLPGN